MKTRRRPLSERLRDLIQRAPTNHEWIALGASPWLGWRAILVEISGELLHDWPQFPSYNRWHRDIARDFDRDTHIFVWWPFAPLAWAWYAWRWSSMRFCIERWLSRRVIDKPEGEAWTMWSWKVRNIRRWSWTRTRAFPPKPPRGPRPAWLDSV